MIRRRIWLVILVVLLVSIAVFAYCQRIFDRDNSDKAGGNSDIKDAGEQLYVIRDNGRYGYIDRDGFVVIKPQYEDGYNFSEGLARVGLQHRYGFIDKTAKIVVRPKFQNAEDFSEGLALVAINNRYGFINNMGEVAIPLDYEFANSFSEGLAVFYKDSKCGYLNKTGEIVIQPKYENAGPFKEGLAAVSEKGIYGYIDNKGQYAIQPQYDYASNFSEGLAAVSLKSKYGFIDAKGTVVIQPRFEQAQDFSEGIAAIKLDGKWGYIDKKGSFVVWPIYQMAEGFSEGRAAVSDGKNWGYIDSKGRLAMKLQYSYADRFYKGLAAVRLDDVLSMVDNQGKLIWHETEKVDIQGLKEVLGTLIKMKIKSETYDLMIKYPQVIDMKDKVLQNKINQILMQQSGTDYKGQQGETFRQDYDVLLNKSGIMSIVNSSFMYMQGAAHGMAMRNAINIDMTTGRLYDLQDLFKLGADYKSKLNDIIKNQIAEDNPPLLREFQGINENQEYYLTEKELVIFYQLYDYTPYAYGFLEFYIPYESINNIIDKKGPLGRIE